jgi:hypothetical protein
MADWTWPPGIAIDLYHWSWEDGRPDRRIRGWSLSGEATAGGAVLLEAERGGEPGLHWIGKADCPTTVRYTVRCAADLPFELRSSDGRPIGWLRRMISASAVLRTDLRYN